MLEIKLNKSYTNIELSIDGIVDNVTVYAPLIPSLELVLILIRLSTITML